MFIKKQFYSKDKNAIIHLNLVQSKTQLNENAQFVSKKDFKHTHI